MGNLLLRTEGRIVILDSSVGDEDEVQILEGRLVSLDMSEETIYHSGPFKRICSNS